MESTMQPNFVLRFMLDYLISKRSGYQTGYRSYDVGLVVGCRQHAKHVGCRFAELVRRTARHSLRREHCTELVHRATVYKSRLDHRSSDLRSASQTDVTQQVSS